MQYQTGYDSCSIGSSLYAESESKKWRAARTMIDNANAQAGQLPNFPMLNQRRSPDANQDFDCVPTCIAAALQYTLSGTGQVFEPNQVKDAVYGASYVGGTAARAFVAYAAQHGAHLFSIQAATGVGLVQAARTRLMLHPGQPVIATEPDPYAPASAAGQGWTHVICFYKWSSTALTALDPWTGADITRSDQEWSTLLLDGEVWCMEAPVPPGAPASPASPGARVIPAGWQDNGLPQPRGALKAPNGVIVVSGFRDYITNPSTRWDSANVPLALESGRAPLLDSNPGYGRGTWQPFLRGVLLWTAQHGVVEMNIGPEIVCARQRLAQLELELEAARAAAPPPAKAAITEVSASARLIEETAQHILTTLQEASTTA